MRGSKQGESHGGVFILDFEKQKLDQVVDWNAGDIDFAGRGADRGLRGIEFDGDDIYIAASDELFLYDRGFAIKQSWRNPYLKHCHEICRRDHMLFLTSTGFDCVLAFDLLQKQFVWGFQLIKNEQGWGGFAFNPNEAGGPIRSNHHHINMVYVDQTGLYISGLKTQALLRINNQNIVSQVCSLPAGTHNARPLKHGIIFNDTANNNLRIVPRSGEQQAFTIRQYDPVELKFTGVDDSKVARQGFGRGLGIVNERFVAGGSSPSTITLYDLERNLIVASVNLTMDIRNAIHGLEPYPY